MKRIAVYCGSNRGTRPEYTAAAQALGALLAREKNMHERKAMMAELSDGFIALPGGYGTFEEFFEVLAWSQLGWHQKPFGLLNIAGFYTHLLQFLDHTTREGFLRPQHRELVIIEDAVDRILLRLQAFRPPPGAKWVK